MEFSVTIYFRWTNRDSPNLKLWKANPNSIPYTYKGDESRKAFWVFKLGGEWQAPKSMMKDRVLVAFEFTEEVDRIIDDSNNAVYFGYNKEPSFEGETKHPDKVILKSNEKGTYGIGAELRKSLCVRLKKNGIRQATKKETAKALGLKERELSGYKKW